MSLLTVVAVAVGLAMDATAVALSTAVLLGRVTRRQVFRFAFHFGLFQGGMPIVGWLAGRKLYAHIEAWDHWVAFALLAAIGIKSLCDSRRSPDGGGPAPVDPTRGWSLVGLSVATSIDALAVGLTFGVLGAAIWLPCVVIAVVTAVMTTAAMLAGSRLGRRLAPQLRGLGGLVLIAIGVQILLAHLSG